MTSTRTVSPVDADAPVGRGLALAGLFALVTLPFVPAWLDFEVARRGLGMAVLGLVLLRFATRREAGWTQRPQGFGFLAALVLWTWLSVPLSAAPTDQALQRALYLAALAALFAAGARVGTDAVLRAVVPTGVLVAAYGTAQALGLDLPAGFARPDQPVSTLGNTNAASEVATFALASTMALAVRGGTRARALVAASVVLGLYVGLNGTRAGLVGVGLAAALVAATRAPRTARITTVTAAVAAVLVGVVLRPAATTPEPETPHATAPSVVMPSTIDVRFALWDGTLDMVADAPFAGHGAGGFRFDYPRFRTAAEIEATSFGRRFPTFAENPHNELLEFAAEGGVVAPILVLLLAWAVARAGLRRGVLADLAPLAAFAFACMVRAPLQNAPVAAAAALLAGALAGCDRTETASRKSPRPLAFVLGAALLGVGTAIVTAATLATRVGDVSALGTAIRLQPGESRYRSLLIQARCGGVDESGLLVDHGPRALAACREDLSELLTSDPNNTNALFLAAQLGLGGGAPELARTALGRILALDRNEPRAQSLTAVLLAREGDVPAAIATLYSNPHASLRARLADVLSELTGLPDLDSGARDLLRREIRFVRAVDALLADPGSGEAAQAILAVAGSSDPRGPVLVAARLRALGQSDEADALAPQARALGDGDLGSLRLLGPLLEPLRGLPRWSGILSERN